jgi:arginine decarboxylase-like protein
MTATQKHNQNVALREKERIQTLSEEMIALHEEWAEIDAVQEAASKIAEKPRVGKRIVMDSKNGGNNQAQKPKPKTV